MTAPFDTLKLAERLGSGGFSAEQAQTAAGALADILSSDLATKADFETFRLQLDAKIEVTRLQLESKIDSLRLELDSLRLDLQGKIAEAKADIIKWVGGIVGFQALVVIGALTTMLEIFVK